MYRNIDERFDAKVSKGDGDGCWEWTAALDGRGYGKFKVRSYTLVQSHRFAYEREFGPIANGQRICHRCDNPLCVRPSHLFAGTAADNTQDMLAKGRGAFGPKSRILARARQWSTECVNGHTRTAENTYVGAGRQVCRVCHRENERRRRENHHAIA